LLLVLWLVISSSKSIVDAEKSPYHVLGVPRDASQKDIQKSYKSLCLKFHPDKNVHKPSHERNRCEEKFKEIQHAYSQIGDERSRRSYDVQEAYGFGRTTSSSQQSYSSSSPFREDPFSDAFFRAFATSGPSFFFATRPDGRPTFGIRRPFPARPTTEYGRSGNLSFKSIYKQTVKVPLESLYTGAEVEFKLIDNVWTRWRAAIRGKIIYLSLYQGLLYSMPMLRTSKILALIVGLFITHATLPKPDPNQSYLSTIPRGIKGNGTRIRFQQPTNGQPEVIFELYEAPHDRYQRVENDLHTHVRVSKREAELGCTKRIPSLDPDQPPITIEIPPQSVQGDIIRIRGKGWPTRNADIHGDLLVKVDIKEQGNAKRRKN
jgi:DnaJ-class molecular chaperone